MIYTCPYCKCTTRGGYLPVTTFPCGTKYSQVRGIKQSARCAEYAKQGIKK